MVVPKLGNDPGICALVEKAAVAWALLNDPPESCRLPPVSEDERARIIEEGEEAKATVLRYADWLLGNNMQRCFTR